MRFEFRKQLVPIYPGGDGWEPLVPELFDNGVDFFKPVWLWLLLGESTTGPIGSIAGVLGHVAPLQKLPYWFGR